MAGHPVGVERLGPRLFVGAVRTAAALVFALAAAAHATGSAIYKCLDNHLGLVYTDIPCKDGEKLDIRAGDADPAAVVRLERIRDQLDQSAAQRISDERRAAAQFAYAQQLRRETEERSAAQQYVSAYDGYFGYGYGAYSPFDGRRLPRERVNKHEHARGFAPNPPYLVPRR
jgi:hypothetical protein